MRIDNIIDRPYNSFTREERHALVREYEAKTGNKLCITCTSSFITAYNELRKMARKAIIPTETAPIVCKYEFKPGFEDSQISVSGLHFAINKENLSDELVEKHLINHPLIQEKA